MTAQNANRNAATIPGDRPDALPPDKPQPAHVPEPPAPQPSPSEPPIVDPPPPTPSPEVPPPIHS